MKGSRFAKNSVQLYPPRVDSARAIEEIICLTHKYPTHQQLYKFLSVLPLNVVSKAAQVGLAITLTCFEIVE